MYRQGECDMLLKKRASMKGFLGLNRKQKNLMFYFSSVSLNGYTCRGFPTLEVEI